MSKKLDDYFSNGGIDDDSMNESNADVSCLSGFASFQLTDAETSNNFGIPNNNVQLKLDFPEEKVEKSEDDNNIFSQFLKKSATPLSPENSLYESTLSLAKLEALDDNEIDANFMRSQTDEIEKNMTQFLSTIKKSKKADFFVKDPPKYLDNDSSENDSMCPAPAVMNQTEMDSIILKDVKNRFGLNSMNETNLSVDIHNNSPFQDRLKQRQSELNRDAERIAGQVMIERPNLDGSSSDSENEKTLLGSNGSVVSVRNKSKTSLDQQAVKHIGNMNPPEDRKPIDNHVLKNISLSNGGGGDGSSGHSEDDADLTKKLKSSAKSLSSELDSDVRVHPPSRERPVGGPGSNIDIVAKQVQFAPSPNLASTHGISFSDEKLSLTLMEDPINELNVTPSPFEEQESRLSSRYFLAASTPFLAASTFSDNSPEAESRTMCLEDFQDEGSILLNEISPNHDFIETSDGKNVSNWIEKNSQYKNGDDIFGSFSIGNVADDFEVNNQDFECMLEEDEKAVAENNDTIVNDHETSGVSEWSVRTDNMRINPDLLPSVCSSNSDGNVSRYFKVKSHDLGKSIGKVGNNRPKFTDATLISSPDKCSPVKLIEETDQLISVPLAKNETYIQKDSNRQFVEPMSSRQSFQEHVISSSHAASTEFRHPEIPSNRKSAQSANIKNFPSNIDSPVNESFSIPICKQEAGALMNSIRERRVSIVGMENTQMESLSKVIASLTGSDASIVYRVLQIMSKENIPVFSGEKNEPTMFRKESSSGKKMSCPNSFSSCNPVASDFDGHYATPMHTVTTVPNIPLYNENSTSDNLYHTLYPSVDRESFNRIPSSQKGNNTFKLAAVTPYQVNSSHTSSSNSRQPSTSGVDSSMLYTCAVPRHMNVNLNDGLSYSPNISFSFCCLGEKTTRIFKIYNSNCCWVQIHFNIIFFAYNGCENSDHHTYPFIVNPSKVVVGPNSSEEIKIKFLPKQTGTFMMKVELLAGPLVDCEDANVNWPRLPKLLTIEGSCEIPDLEVLLGDEKCVDFGEVSYGTFSSRELKILNKGKADITVRLAISSSQSSVGFTFENSLNVASVDGNPQQSLAVIKGTVDGSIPLTPTVVTIKFQAPRRPSESQKQQNLRSPEELSCQLDIKTATEHIFSISRVLIKAMVGYLRLHSLRTLQPICLSCAEGTQSKEVIPLRNAGNLTLSLSIDICGLSDFFTASPSQLKLQPGEESEVKILFSPDVPAYVESILKVSILPDGDEYEWTLKGKSSKAVPTVSKSKKSNLLCNTHALNWAGVSIGQSQQQKLILRNSSDNESIQLSLNIAGDNSNFQIVKDVNFAQKDLNKFEAVIGPKGELPIHILFVPTYLHMANSSLVLRTLDGMNKFVIPLSGYGGKSQLDISGANNLRNQYWIDMDEVYLGKKNVMNLMLRNSGSRAAFISIKCYSDITARLEYPDTHVCITPNNFVLKEKVSTQITLSYQPLQDHAKKLQEGSYTSAHLVIYSGDEVLRKTYRKHIKGIHGNQILKNLDTPFTNEENVKEEVSYTMVSDWNNFLDACLDKTIIALVARYPSEPSKQTSQDDMQEMLVHATPAQKLKTSMNKENESNKIWAVSPEKIVLNSTEDGSSAKLKILNYSHKVILFEFIWPGQTLVITPCKEKIPPRSQLVIKVNAKTSFLASEDLPWKGNLYVLCNGEQKGIEVEICADSVSLQSPMLPPNEMVEMFPNDISIIPHLSKSNEKTTDQHITLNPHILEFSKTNVGVATESIVNIANRYNVPCEWNLISIAPPYCKSLDGNSTITRVTYTAFRFSKQSGTLGAKESMKLSVSFNPRAEGMYSQYWEIEVSSERISKSKVRLEVNGLGYNSNEPSERIKNNSIKEPTKLGINGSYNSVTCKKIIDKNRSVIVKDSLVTFPQTNVGEKNSMSFRLCNRSERVQKVELTGFKAPFNIDHTTLTLRAKHYLRVPIYFSPQVANTVSHGLVDINLEDGSSITVKIVGKSN